MNDSSCMSFCQVFSGMLQIAQKLSQFGVLAVNFLAQRDTIDNLHRYVMRSISFANLEDLRNVRMTQRCRGLCLPNKMFFPITTCREIDTLTLHGALPTGFAR